MAKNALKTNSSAKTSVKLGYDILVERGPIAKPVAIQFWTEPKKYENFKSAEPFKYHADALVGLSTIQLNTFLKSPLVVPCANYSNCHQLWQELDPHFQIYFRSNKRVTALAEQLPKADPNQFAEFEKKINATIDQAQKSWGFDLRDFWPIIDAINSLESKTTSALLFNFKTKFSKEFVNRLHFFYSLLFHIRSVIAVDHNAHVVDPSHEALKVDSISDYLHRPEYITNDAVLYLNFKKLCQPWTMGKTSDVRIEKLLVEPLASAFRQYSHNACQLIDQLPPSFLNSLPKPDLAEALHLVQMDWLLGSEAGLLFKIREELFGLQNGYEKIFYPDMEGQTYKKAMSLSVCCELQSPSQKDLSTAA